MTAATPGRELLALHDKLAKAKASFHEANHIVFEVELTEHEMLDVMRALRLAAKPADEGVRIPFDADAKLGYVWLIWGVTKERVDLIAIATTEEACGRYLEAGKQMRRYIAVKEEQAFVDHLYGGGLLKAITNARLPLSTTGEPKR